MERGLCWFMTIFSGRGKQSKGTAKQPGVGIGQVVEHVEMGAAGYFERTRVATSLAQGSDVVVRLAAKAVGFGPSDGAEIAGRAIGASRRGAQGAGLVG